MATRSAGASDFGSDDVADPTDEAGDATLPSDYLAALVRIEGTTETSVHPILAETFVLGRVDECDLKIGNDKQVSRTHARIVRRAFHFILEDLKSANGVRINGKAITEPTELKVGDRIQIGNHIYLFSRNRSN